MSPGISRREWGGTNTRTSWGEKLFLTLALGPIVVVILPIIILCLIVVLPYRAWEAWRARRAVRRLLACGRRVLIIYNQNPRWKDLVEGRLLAAHSGSAVSHDLTNHNDPVLLCDNCRILIHLSGLEPADRVPAAIILDRSFPLKSLSFRKAAIAAERGKLSQWEQREAQLASLMGRGSR